MALLLMTIGCFAQTKTNEMMVTYKKTVVSTDRLKVEDCKVFYREAGSKDKPAILLLHGFPSASHMFRELIRTVHLWHSRGQRRP